MKTFRVQEKLMGSAFELIAVAGNETAGQKYLKAGIAEIQRIEDLLSEFKPASEISALNLQAGKNAVRVSEEVYGLVERCLHLYKISGGAFDITVGPLKKLYNFKNKEFSFPSPESIKNTRDFVGSHLIDMRPDRSIFLKKEKMHISMAAIGKGYAADCVKRLWKDAGVSGGVINASGDLTVLGQKPDGKPWIAGVPDPDRKDKMVLYIPLQNNAIATSGDSEQFFMKDGIRYSHTINPGNGLPLTGIKSVSVVSPAAELSDALATAMYVMGRKAGLDFISQFPGIYAIIIDEKNKIHFSEKIEVSEERILDIGY